MAMYSKTDVGVELAIARQLVHETNMLPVEKQQDHIVCPDTFYQCLQNVCHSSFVTTDSAFIITFGHLQTSLLEEYIQLHSLDRTYTH